MRLVTLLSVIAVVGGVCCMLATDEVMQVAGQERVDIANQEKFRFPLLHRPYGIADRNTEGFESFEEIYLAFRPGEDWTNASIDAKDGVSLEGFVKLKDGTKYRFREASLAKEGNYFKKLTVVTEPVCGVHYALTGTFFETPQFRETYYVDMSGTLKKFNGELLLLDRQFEFFDLSDG
jgi:hypothetical protein